MFLNIFLKVELVFFDGLGNRVSEKGVKGDSEALSIPAASLEPLGKPPPSHTRRLMCSAALCFCPCPAKNPPEVYHPLPQTSAVTLQGPLGFSISCSHSPLPAPSILLPTHSEPHILSSGLLPVPSLPSFHLINTCTYPQAYTWASYIFFPWSFVIFSH